MGSRIGLWCFLLFIVGSVATAQPYFLEGLSALDLSQEEFYSDDSSERTKCPLNEHFDRCQASCQKTCFNYNQNPITCPSDCESGCICDNGYVRGPDGRCIRPKKCPKNLEKEFNEEEEADLEFKIREEEESKHDAFTISIFCKKHEQYSLCPSRCPDNCTNYMDTKRPCNLICLPLPECVCKSGYVVGPDGQCIKPDQCPREKRPEDCTDMEQYTTCGTSCEDNCDNYKEKDRECDTSCKVGCFCLPGYVRGPKGDCIFPFDCPAKAMAEKDYKLIEKVIDIYDQAEKEKEDRTEETYTEPYEMKPAEVIQEIEINPDVFHQTIFCKKNEVYSLCPVICPDNCTNYQDKTRACRKICLPLPGCVCKSGFVKGPDGTCIKPEKCKKEQKPDDCSDLEYYDTCGSSCPDDCSNYNNEERTCEKQCNIGCFCRPGMVRGPNGQCIWPFECEIKPSSAEASESSFCPMHEEFHPCHASSELDCSNRDNKTPPKPPAWCLAGCRCLTGYVRGPDGLCIEPSQCPDDDNTRYPVQRVCPENEKWSSVAQCQRNCSDPGIRLCPQMSSPGCICKEGLMRNTEGMCIPEEGCQEQQGVGITEASQGHRCWTQSECKGYCISKGKRGGYCLDRCICYD